MLNFNDPIVRRIEHLGAAALLSAILAAGVWYMATHKAPEPYLPAQVTEEATVPEPQTLEEHAQYYDIEATYPAQTPLKESVSGEADLKALASMQRFIEETVTDFKKQGDFQNLTPEDIQIMGFADGRKESLAIEYTEQTSARTHSYVYTLYLDTLGAHPNTFYRTFTFDRTTGKELALADLFLPKAKYLARLSAIARFELPKQIGEFADVEYITQGTTPEAVTFQTFALDEQHLIIIFPPYQVGPYSLGTQTLRIPLITLKDILKPEFSGG